MLEIDSRAWHLRWIRRWNKSYRPTNLCRHFWLVLFPYQRFLFKAIAIVIAAAAILYIGLALVGIWVLLAVTNSPWYLFGLFSGPALVLVLLGAQLALKFLMRLVSKRSEPVTDSSGPSLTLEWLKAKKRRVCPLIVETGLDEVR